MPRKLDKPRLAEALKQALIQTPGLNAAEICRNLDISQPVFSRMLTPEILMTGKRRNALYSLKREIPEIGNSIPIYEVDEKGKPQKAADLIAIYPRGFYLQAHETHKSKFYADLPYFLEDLRPAGFLGRLVPKAHPDLNAPTDIRDWSGDNALQYITRYGWNLIGNLILGEAAFKLHLENIKTSLTAIKPNEREVVYSQMASNALEIGPAGSSAGGEQPKFLALKDSDSPCPVIVKFSPPRSTEIGQRVADLLICEHIAHTIMQDAQVPSSRSEIIDTQDRIFLEIERFDRYGMKGRQGVISLGALDLVFVGKLKNWKESARDLFQKKLISEKSLKQIYWLQAFGEMIANSDMHLGNLSFFYSSFEIEDLAPAYDMLPMLYAPQNQQLIERKFESPLPSPDHSHLWKNAWAAALKFWNEVNKHPKISKSFQKIAKENLKKLSDQKEIIELLP